mmetsp:Transcript_41711/g.67408  ORF Transcript_41711/g.67408 Transcript_41711/m.67408 type:complete len:205 (+) Transcript_41711:408-1022(+)
MPIGRLGEDSPHHRREVLQGQGLVVWIKGWLVPVVAEALAGVEVRAAPQHIAGIFLRQTRRILVVEGLEDLVVHQDPVILRADVRPEKRTSDFAVVDGSHDLSDVVQHCNNYRLFIRAVPECSGSCLHRVLMLVDQVADVHALELFHHSQRSLRHLVAAGNLLKLHGGLVPLLLGGFLEALEVTVHDIGWRKSTHGGQIRQCQD